MKTGISFESVKKMIEALPLGVKFNVVEYADYCIGIMIRMKDIECQGLVEEYYHKYQEVNDSIYAEASVILSDSYVTGKQVIYSDRIYNIPNFPLADKFREKLMPVLEKLKEYGFQPDGMSCKSSWWGRDKEGKYESWEGIRIGIKNDVTLAYRDCCYDDYVSSGEAEREHEMERRAEIAYEDMITGFHNI